MYRVNVNAAYYESNLKIKQTNKCRYSLTEQQKQFIEMQLPRGYRLTLVGETDQKRNRTPRKTDSQFQTQFSKKQPRKQIAISEKKNDKKQDRKAKEEVGIKIQPIQQAFFFKKEAIENKKVGKSQNEAQLKKSLQMKIEQKTFQLKLKTQQFRPETKKNQQQMEKSKNANSIMNQEIGKSEIQKSVEKPFQAKQQAPKIKIDQANQVVLFPEPKSSELNNFEHKQFCLRFINKLKAHKSSWPFRQPVDPITQGVPNYLEVIHEPMDLKTIEKKVIANKYEHIAQFHGDINKIFLNSYKFNPKQINYYALTIELQSYYHQLLKEIESNPNALQNDRPSKNIRTKTSNSEQDFADETVNKKNKFPHQAVPKLVEPSTVTNAQINAQQIKQKAGQSLPKQTKNLAPKAKPKKPEVDRKDLVKRVQKLSSKALERVLLTAFGEIDDEKTTFNLDFQKLPEQSILKIDTIARAEFERFSEAKNCFAGIQKRMLLF